MDIRIKAALALAGIEMANGSVNAETKNDALSEAMLLGVTTNEYLRAHALLKAGGERLVIELFSNDVEDRD
jgi:hypothetical protein